MKKAVKGRKWRPKWVDKGLLRLVEWATRVDAKAAAQRVQLLKALNPEQTPAALAEQLIRQKCVYTARMGAATSATRMVPVLGSALALTVGVLVDLGASLSAQAELVLELAEVYDYPLTEANKRETILVVLGLGTGTEYLTRKASREATERLIKRYVKRWATRVIPVAGIAASASAAALTTYLIGRRAEKYFTQGETPLEDWKDSLRAFSGLDERKLLEWLSKVKIKLNKEK